MKSMSELRSKHFRVLYHLNYYDGPISGVCLWNGETHYFECRDPDSMSRTYIVYKTPSTDMDIISKNHELFSKYVGTHTEYDENGRRHYNLRPYSSHKKFYENQSQSFHTLKFDIRKKYLESWEILGRFKSPF